MINSIEKYYENAQLSQASYGLFTSYDATSVKARLSDKDFTELQASIFSDPSTGYTLLSHQPNTLSGFSASVFKSASGEYTLAIRGTEVDLAGLVTDWGLTNIADIGFNGIAISQAIDLTLDNLNVIFKAASADPAKSLESIVNAHAELHPWPA